METGFVVLLVVAAATVGVLAGMLINRSGKKSEGTQGVIYAYYDESKNDPSLLLEYSVPINDIASRKQVRFDICVVRNSHE